MRPLQSMLTLIAFVFTLSAHAVPAQGHKIIVAGPSPYSAEIVQKISAQGGNVVDCAVAVAMGLAVTTPYFAALGGGGFALVKMGTNAVQALDFREMAPKSATADMYTQAGKDSSITGGLAVGVPGVTAGMEALHKKYGKLPWAKVLAPALQLARDGIRVSGEWSSTTSENLKRFNDGAKLNFFKKNLVPYQPGEIFKQPHLASALELISKKGASGFYSGTVAQDIVSAVKAGGGMITLQDLRDYKVRWLEPITAEFNDYKLYLMPPPSSGGVVLKEAFALAERIKLRETAPLSADELHGIGEVLKMSFRGRSLLGDPDFSKVPIAQLTSDDYLQSMASHFKKDKVMKLEPIKEEASTAPEHSQTTHFSILDTDGNSVSLTVTLNEDYGSAVVSPKYGIALNNEMDDFTTRPGQPNMFGLIQGKANEIAPGKRPLSSMSPTLVEKAGKIVMSLGAPGGPRIISGVFQVMYRVLAQGWNIDQAIQAPRVHHQFLPDTLLMDARKVSPDTIAILKKRGHTVKEQGATPEEFGVAKVYGVVLRPDGVLEGAFDSRGEGGAGGI